MPVFNTNIIPKNVSIFALRSVGDTTLAKDPVDGEILVIREKVVPLVIKNIKNSANVTNDAYASYYNISICADNVRWIDTVAESYSFIRIQYSNDDGATWITLASLSGDPTSVPTGRYWGQFGFEGSIDLVTAPTNNRLRFRLIIESTQLNGVILKDPTAVVNFVHA